jgi:predicted CopG family antitoxin
MHLKLPANYELLGCRYTPPREAQGGRAASRRFFHSLQPLPCERVLKSSKIPLQKCFSCVIRACMPSINITISVEAHERLSALKKPGQSFSDVILEHVERPAYETAGELLESFKEEPIPYKCDPVAMNELKNNRGRRSPRPEGYGR